MRQCPLCSRLYDDAVGFCPQDNRVLFLPDPLLGQVIDGKYRIDALLGGGGQGTVYRAIHVHLQRNAAFKVVRSDFVADAETTDRFKREALTVARLKHPHIVTIHDFGISPEVGAYLVMEHLEGHSLHEEIRQRTRIPVGGALELMAQICTAVHAAHTQGVVHRDLKPENIFLEARPDGARMVKILDFGVAKLRGASSFEASSQDAYRNPRLTMAGKVFGTPAYMSPEQAAGELLDARSDIYSLACVFYEMISGRPPFVYDGLTALHLQHVQTEPKPPSEYANGIPGALDAVLLRALAKQREARPQTAEEFAAELGAVSVSAEARPAIFWTASVGSARAGRSTAEQTDGSASFEPTPMGLRRPAHNLPQQMTSFVGREQEIERVKEMVSTNRLVTLTGPSGCGKTRLSLQVAGETLFEYPDGVWLVELAALGDPALVPQAVASALGVREEPGKPLVEALVGFLRTKDLLLIFDNCEHLVAACAALAGTILRTCPDLRVLATSQEALGVLGEVAWLVPTLPVPDLEHLPPADRLAASGAVRLFVERAVLSVSGFTLTEQNAPAVARICHRLDGIPLAIELAAARVKLLTPDQIASRLDDRFHLLTGGSRTAQPRQRTLQAAVDWSYDLLGEVARVVFNRLSVFAAGFTFEAAEAVCGDTEAGRLHDESGGASTASRSTGPLTPPSDLSIHPSEVLDFLAHLVDKSLVVVEESGGESRYRLLQTLRQYAGEKLRLSGEAGAIRSRHRDYYLMLAETAESELRGPEQGTWLNRLELEHDNLRAALDWSKVDAAASDASLRLAGALAQFWLVRGHTREGRVWLEGALTSGGSPARAVRAKALHGAGVLVGALGDYARAVAYLEESLALRRKLSDTEGMASSLNNLGFVAQWQGDYARAEALHRESLELARQHNHRWELANSLNNMGAIEQYRGDYERAIAPLKESLSLFRELGDERKVADTLNNLGIMAANQGDFPRASALFEENLALRRKLGDRRGITMALNNLGEVAQLRGEFQQAATLLGESLVRYEEEGNRRGVAYSLEGFVSIAAAQGHAERALQLAGASAALREAIGSPLSPTEQADLDHRVEKARATLGDEQAARAFDDGRGMHLDDAMKFALAT